MEIKVLSPVEFERQQKMKTGGVQTPLILKTVAIRVSLVIATWCSIGRIRTENAQEIGAEKFVMIQII
jgi:hypothetical protein